MSKDRIRISLDENDTINWQRGGEGMCVAEFVSNNPCLALQYLTLGGMSTELGDAILSSIGGRGKLYQFNNENGCNQEDNLLQQI